MSNETHTTAAHLEEARRRGRGLLAAESVFRVPEELQQAARAARDAVVFVMILWAVLVGAGMEEHVTDVLVSAAIAMATYTGIANGLAVANQLRFWVGELRRERDEIREHPEKEREELRAIYEAKGFKDEMLDEIVDTLCADEDRLLKIMLEEELGIFLEQQNHPVVTGLATGVASLVVGVFLALLACDTSVGWVVGAALMLLVLLAFLRTGSLRSSMWESWARWSISGGFVAGVGYLLARYFGGQLL